MAASKKKIVKQVAFPKGKTIEQKENPESIMQLHPSWNFSVCDNEKWALTKETAIDLFWDEVLPKLKSFESQTWSNILIDAKNKNHSIECALLNTVAQKRLEEKYIEIESIVSLRLNGTHRIYGYRTGAVFNILWYDLDHGDNDTCVCKSTKKHT